MYKIRGADQKEYGPVSAEVVRQWIAERRANANTMIQAEGSREWNPLATLPEFSEALAAAAPPPGLSAPGGLGPGARPVGPGTPLGAPMPPPAKTSGLAITSMVLGILGMCGITALIGLITGIIALAKIGKSQGRLGGKGFAIAGICLSGFFLLLVPFWVALTLPALDKAKTKTNQIKCITNLKQLSLGLRMYAADNGEKLPLAAKWCDAIQNDIGSPNVFRCPGSRSGQRCTYAFNEKLSGMSVERVDPRTVLLFEIEGGWNVAGGPTMLMSFPRHGAYNILCVDGSVQQISPKRLSQLRWNP